VFLLNCSKSSKTSKGPKNQGNCERKRKFLLKSVFLLEFLVLLPEGINAINHDLDELNLRVSQPVLVGHIVCAAIEATRLTTGSSGLDSKLLTSLLESIQSLLGVSRKINHDGGPHSSPQVSGTGVDETILLRQGKVLATLFLYRFTHSLDTSDKASKDTLDVTTLLHGDDPHLILLIDPEQESLLLVVEDATSLRPITLHTSNSKVPVSRHEEEVIIHQLLANLLIHPSKRVVCTGQVTSQLSKSILHQVLNTQTLILGNSRRQTKSINGSSNSYTSGVYWDTSVHIPLDLADIHVSGVLSGSTDTMVVLDDSIEDLSEVLVGVPISSINTAVLIIKLDSAGDGLSKSEASSLGSDVLDFVPSLLGHMFGDQGVLGLDDGELSGHDL